MRTINASQVLCQKGCPYNYLDSKTRLVNSLKYN